MASHLKVESQLTNSVSPSTSAIPLNDGNVSIEKAMEYRLETSATNVVNGKHVRYKCCQFKTKDFGVFGTGIFLYFKILKQLSLIFFIMFILSTPLMLSAISTKELPQTSFQFEQISLGNLGDNNVTNISMTMLSVLAVSEDIPKNEAGIVFGATDLLGIGIFLAFILIKGVTQKKIAQEIDDEQTTVADFALKITGLPKTLYNREELQAFFQDRWGKIMDVAICYNDVDIIRKYINKSQTIGDIESAKKREKFKQFKKLSKKFEKHNKKLNKKQNKFSKQCVCAFITFNDCDDMVKCVNDYPDTMLARLMMPKSLRFRGKYRIKVEKAPEPSEIIYDNMVYSNFNIFMRRSITAILTIIALLASSGMVYGATLWKKDSTVDVTVLDCEEYDAIIDPISILTNTTDLTDDQINCLCSKVSYSDLFNVNECTSFLHQLIVGNLLVVAACLVVVGVNIIFGYISRKLVEFEKHTSITKLEKQLVLKLFVGLFFNTALVYLLINANMSSYVGGVVITTLFDGDYSDFTSDWYDIVGNYLTLTLIMNALNPHIIPVVTYPLKLIQLKQANKKCVTQRELNKAYEGDTFILAERYAVLINTVWVTLFYSSGMPLLLFIACITFIIQYICDKFTLLYRAKRPPKYSIDIAQFALKLLKPAVYIHLMMTIWIYGRETILLHQTIDSIKFLPFYIFGTFGNEMNQMCMNWNTFPMFALLIILLCIDISDYILSTFKIKQLFIGIMKRILTILCPCLCKFKEVNVVHVQENIDTFSNELKKGNKFESYLVSHQHIYYDAYLEGSGLYKQDPLYIKQKYNSENDKIV